jgi:alkylation response protein AidB-like acyl-CoA dehydrogenase
VDFKFSEEQTMLESAISRFLSDRYSFDKRREILARHAGFDPAIWSEFATSLGILGVTLPEEAGGLAGGAVETLQEGVLRSVADANIGSVLGIGAPSWTGGFLQFVNTYGVDAFRARATRLAEHYGPRFSPPAMLARMTEHAETFQ